MFGALIPSGSMTQPEAAVALLGILVVAGISAAAFFKWIVSGPASPDPWDQEGLTPPPDGQGSVLCHRCLVPNSPDTDFCENCGAPIGEYTNYLPYPYLFSLGYLLRAGTSGEFKRTRFTVLGFVLLSLAEYTIFAPVYLYQFFKRGLRGNSSAPPRAG